MKLEMLKWYITSDILIQCRVDTWSRDAEWILYPNFGLAASLAMAKARHSCQNLIDQITPMSSISIVRRGNRSNRIGRTWIFYPFATFIRVESFLSTSIRLFPIPMEFLSMMIPSLFFFSWRYLLLVGDRIDLVRKTTGVTAWHESYMNLWDHIPPVFPPERNDFYKRQ